MAISMSASVQSDDTPRIIDIRQDTSFTSLVDQIHAGLSPVNGGEKSLPTLLLYDENGLKLFEKITYLDEYYLTRQEIYVLEHYAERIADRIALKPGSIIVELGSGNLRKVKILLDALDRKGIDVTYYALDLSLEELTRTLAAVPKGTFSNVKCFGLLGTYNDGLAWLKEQDSERPKTVLSLGSSVGNFDRAGAAQFISEFADVLTHSDTLLVGVDACTDSEKVYQAYNDREGLTHEFILNGLTHANALLGHEAFHVEDWKVIGRYNEKHHRHEAFVTPTKDVEIDGVTIRAHEQIRIEESWKYDQSHLESLWAAAHVTEGTKWTNEDGNYALHLLNRPKVAFSTKPSEYAASPVPSLTDWNDLWVAWDTVTQEMLPEDELLDKPIKLRNACIFYLGHIPTFVDIHLTRATRGKPTPPSYYTQIFERGIDPDVDDPEQCHSHSEVPDSWPPVSEVLDFQTRVRQRIQGLYDSGAASKDRVISRALWLGYEHEIMHLETLLYMLVQSEKTLAPPSTIRPDFEMIAAESRRNVVENEWFTIPAQDVSIGLDDPDDNSGPDHYLGWDNEKPKRIVHVPSFKAQARPITNGEYAHYLRENEIEQVPASWMSRYQSSSNGAVNKANGHSGLTSQEYFFDKAVRTVYGAVPLEYALDWPVAASYDELAGCAKWMGGRIPTMEETRSIYLYVDDMKSKDIEQAINVTIPAVNGHLINNGVQESPPATEQAVPAAAASSPTNVTDRPDPNDVHVDLEGTNVGFKHWHPVSVTSNGNKLAGQAGMGGVWEWTSTTLAPHEGFEAMKLYPGYTSDFFDNKHNIVLGGSWATHPRIAGRKSFVNWYQRNYLYVWAGARLVKDL
ncbi:hypothetical protein AAFC00_006900 [Neodothiora populina]|uniref:Uncharacterized protein n=1 Tax=Neodothiora populina TaxID=2781224 RepID=A0ABR3PBI9_9PEZI